MTAADGGSRHSHRGRGSRGDPSWGGLGGPGGPGGPPWGGPGRWRGPRRGFGCLFGLVFLVVAGSLLAAATTVFSRLGLVAGVITFLVVIAALVAVARTFRRTARQLDTLVEATRRVEAGDYTVRVGTPLRAARSMRDLSRGFDTMVERLEIDERQRRDLLADLSHELRTPLTVIAGDVEAMLDGVRPADAEHLAAVLDETRVLGRLIDDLRTMALSEAGTLALHRESVDADVLIDEVVRSFSGTAATAEVTVRTEIDGDLPIIEVDPVRIREILGNLLANAIRHTPPGGSVTVAASTSMTAAAPTSAAGQSHPDDHGWIQVDVIDTGSGIDPELLPHVFDRFVKAPGSGGSGLGLAIARSLALAHGGTLEVVATGSAGTTFRLRLPVA